jgi:opacity protein-like surface antigen
MKKLLIIISVLAFSASASAADGDELISAMDSYFELHGGEMTQSAFTSHWSKKGFDCNDLGEGMVLCTASGSPGVLAKFAPRLVFYAIVSEANNTCRMVRNAAHRRWGRPTSVVDEALLWEGVWLTRSFTPKGVLWDNLCAYEVRKAD